MRVDETPVSGTKGDVTLRFHTPLAFGRVVLTDLENQSLRPDEKYTLFFLCGRVPSFEDDLKRYMAVKQVARDWQQHPRKTSTEKELAILRETEDLPKLERKVVEGIKEGIRNGRLVFKASSQPLSPRTGQVPGDWLRAEMATYWPKIYTQFDRCPVKIINDQRAIKDALEGTASTSDVKALNLYDSSGQLNPTAPLLDAIRVYLAAEQGAGRRVLGQAIRENFSRPFYGWDPNAVRVGVAALVRAGAVAVVVGQLRKTDPTDSALVDALRQSRLFDKVELILEDIPADPTVLERVRKFLMRVGKKRGIDETPAALAQAAGELADTLLAKAADVRLWVDGAAMPLPSAFTEGETAWKEVQSLTRPVHRVNKVDADPKTLEAGLVAIELHADFQERNRIAFAELASLVSRLEAIEHLAEPTSSIGQLLAAWRDARTHASFADKETWKRLQALRAAADLELPAMLDGWRTEARSELDAALGRLPDDLRQNNLNGELESSLSKPLTELRNGLDAITGPVQVAALPERAKRAVKQLRDRFANAVRARREAERPVTPEPEKPTPQSKPGEPPSTTPTATTPKATDPVPPIAKRPLRTVHPSDVATLTHFSHPDDWVTYRDQLDQTVLRLLKEGYDVELD